jgi:hypothetical protein
LKRFRTDLHSRPNLLQPADDDPIACMDAVENDGIVADSFTQVHGPYRDFVRAIDDRELMATL